MSKIVTLTMNPAVDVSTSVDQVVPNRKLRCSEATREPGGGGINVARAIQRLGGEARALFVAGGPSGERLAGMLTDEGITPHPIEISHETRETLNVTESSSGNQFRFIMEGPELATEEWQGVLETVRTLEPQPEYLVASGSLSPGVPPDFYGRLAKIAGERGIRLVVDTSGAALQHAASSGTFLLKPNIHEFRQLTGAEKGGGFSDMFLEGAARSLVASGRAEAVLLSIGAGGAILATKDGAVRIVAPTVEVKSRVGAGDSSVAGTVLALARGMSLRDAATFGIAAGTAAVMTPGSQLCTREDTERLFREMGGTLE